MSIPDDVRRCLEDEIGRYDTGRCVQIGPADALVDWPAYEIDRITLEPAFSIQQHADFTQPRMQLAIVLDAPRALSRATTRQLLGQLRNFSASAIVAAFSRDGSSGDRWATSEFLGLGFRRLASARTLQSRYWIYRYDIRDYKITPDWLNSRFWANPERWDKSRW